MLPNNINNMFTQNEIITIIVLMLTYIGFIYLFAKQDDYKLIQGDGSVTSLPKVELDESLEGYRTFLDSRPSTSSYTTSDHSGNNIWVNRSLGATHKDCYSLSKDKCMGYSNCGLCQNKESGNWKCLPGDEQGPFFKEGCNKWGYGDCYDGRIFNEKRISVTRPHDYQYCSSNNKHGHSEECNCAYCVRCEYEQWQVSPQVRGTL
jgi:hypothetical protein